MLETANPHAAVDPNVRIAASLAGPARVAGAKSASGAKRSPWARVAASMVASLALGGATAGALSVIHSAAIIAVGVTGFGLAAVAASIGGWFSGVAIARAAKSPHRVALVFSGLVLLAVNAAMTLFGALLALLSTAQFSRGRQLRRFGRVLLPELQPGAESSGAIESIEVDVSARSNVAAQWRENAKTEHASVAAFARLTLDLMALGAPSSLIEAAHKDGLDEIRHTQMCLSLAAAIDGERRLPAAFPEAQRARTLPRPRSLALAQLAVDSLVDGALHEGVSARVIARLAKIATAPAVRETLAKIAADEGRHSAHGWGVVEWCVSAGGAPVVGALVGAARALPRAMRSPLPAGAEHGSWERWGIHGRTMETQEYAKARAHVAHRVAEMVPGLKEEAVA